MTKMVMMNQGLQITRIMMFWTDFVVSMYLVVFLDNWYGGCCRILYFLSICLGSSIFVYQLPNLNHVCALVQLRLHIGDQSMSNHGSTHVQYI